MAMINGVVADHFSPGGDLQAIVADLDTGLYTAGLSVRMMRDMVLHGSPGTGSSACDVEEVAASAEGLLAYLGHLGAMVDLLDSRIKSAPAATEAPGSHSPRR